MQVRLEHLCSQALLGELVAAPSSESPAASTPAGETAAPEAAHLDCSEEEYAAAASPASSVNAQAVASPLSGLQVLYVCVYVCVYEYAAAASPASRVHAQAVASLLSGLQVLSPPYISV